ncbi:hypothetical protein [Bdellovibrio bacteriovorus]|uniref:hypothetical protein n=1 Tax=Bdellovibrio bacteriovorus TaxID=959 RepID=UPI0035A73B8D
MTNTVLARLEKSYRRNPTDKNFYLLHQEAQKIENFQLVSVIYEVKYGQEYRLRNKHLTDAFLLEERWLEAQYFCDLWLDSSPNSIDALRVGFIIATKRGSYRRAHAFYDRLRAANAPENLIWLARTIFSLVFENCHQAEAYAANMLLSPPPLDALSLAVALEVAIRTKNGDLLFETLVRMARVPSLTPWQNRVVVETLRVKLLTLLKDRAEMSAV